MVPGMGACKRGCDGGNVHRAVYLGHGGAVDIGGEGSHAESLGATVRSALSFQEAASWYLCRARIIRLATGSDTSLPTTSTSHLDEKSSSRSLAVPALPSSLPNSTTFRSAPPFVFSHDIPRGILLMVQVTLNYAFMLAVMCVFTS